MDPVLKAIDEDLDEAIAMSTKECVKRAVKIHARLSDYRTNTLNNQLTDEFLAVVDKLIVEALGIPREALNREPQNPT